MQGAEERRLTAKERYLREAYGAIRRKEERSKATRLEPCEIPSRRGDDALMVDQGKSSKMGTDTNNHTPFAQLSPTLNTAPPNPRHIHLMGICGTGMASLAGTLKEKGYLVTG
ncbi:MAG: hypothetical protein V3W19_14050, partial [Desulfatiglandales bacterium]